MQILCFVVWPFRFQNSKIPAKNCKTWRVTRQNREFAFVPYLRWRNCKTSKIDFVTCNQGGATGPARWPNIVQGLPVEENREFAFLASMCARAYLCTCVCLIQTEIELLHTYICGVHTLAHIYTHVHTNMYTYTFYVWVGEGVYPCCICFCVIAKMCANPTQKPTESQI